MNSVRITGERTGVIVYEKEEPFMDKFEELRQGTGPAAQVSATVGIGQDFGRLKVSATVTLTCDQNEGAIDAAYYRALIKCAESTTQAMELLTRQEETPG